MNRDASRAYPLSLAKRPSACETALAVPACTRRAADSGPRSSSLGSPTPLGGGCHDRTRVRSGGPVVDHNRDHRHDQAVSRRRPNRRQRRGPLDGRSCTLARRLAALRRTSPVGRYRRPRPATDVARSSRRPRLRQPARRREAQALLRRDARVPRVAPRRRLLARTGRRLRADGPSSSDRYRRRPDMAGHRPSVWRTSLAKRQRRISQREWRAAVPSSRSAGRR